MSQDPGSLHQRKEIHLSLLLVSRVGQLQSILVVYRSSLMNQGHTAGTGFTLEDNPG